VWPGTKVPGHTLFTMICHDCRRCCYCGDAMPSCAKPVNPGTEIVPVFRNASCVVTLVNRIGISGMVRPTGSGGGFDGS